jgi:hypothetical protein
MGHFCPAQDFNRDDDPACAPCLQGLPCTAQQVRSKEFEKAVAPIAQPVVTKPSLPKPDLLRGEKLAATMEGQAAKPGPCAWGCGKPRHRGVCAARRAALLSTGTTFAAFIPSPDEQRLLIPAGQPPDRPSRIPLPVPVPDTAHVDEELSDLPTARERVGLLAEVLAEPLAQQTLEDPFNQATVRKALGLPVFEVVSRSQVQLRAERNDPYAELADRLRRLGPGDLLKISLPSEAAAGSYAKNFSRRLRKYKLRVKYERHGDVIFLEVKPPVLSTSEVPAP